MSLPKHAASMVSGMNIIYCFEPKMSQNISAWIIDRSDFPFLLGKKKVRSGGVVGGGFDSCGASALEMCWPESCVTLSNPPCLTVMFKSYVVHHKWCLQIFDPECMEMLLCKSGAFAPLVSFQPREFWMQTNFFMCVHFLHGLLQSMSLHFGCWNSTLAEKEKKKKSWLAEKQWVQFTSFPWLIGLLGDMTDDSAKILFQSLLRKAIVSHSGRGRDVNSLML